jgi:hypothetical protein
MNREQIIQMAREAGWKDLRDFDSEMREEIYMGKLQDLERFAELVRKDYSTTHANLWLDRIHKFMLEEREACAKVLDEMAEQMVADMEPSTAIAWVRNRAEFIRARGETK